MIKKLLKIFFWILLLAIVCFGIFCYEKLKDKDSTNSTTSNLEKIIALQRDKEKEEKLIEDEKRNSKNQNINSNGTGDNIQNTENGEIDNNSVEAGSNNSSIGENGNSTDNKDKFKKVKDSLKNIYNNVSEKAGNVYKSAKDIAENPNEYDTFNFDLSILLFEGEQKGSEVKKMLNRILETSTDRLYTNTTVTLKNGGNTVKKCIYSYETHNGESFISNLTDVKNSINDNGKYNISFGYNKIKTRVNEIIIDTK